MKKFILVLLYLMISACTSVEEEDLDSNSIAEIGVTHRLFFKNQVAYLAGARAPYTGLYTDHYPNGNKKSAINYTSGKRNGLTQEWYEDGTKKIEMTYQFGKVHGYVFGWNKNGQQTLKLSHVHGKITPSLTNAKQLYALNRYEEAFPIYQHLAEKNVTQAQFLLGYMYNYGQGTPPNADRAYFWYHKAAQVIIRKNRHAFSANPSVFSPAS